MEKYSTRLIDLQLFTSKAQILVNLSVCIFFSLSDTSSGGEDLRPHTPSLSTSSSFLHGAFPPYVRTDVTRNGERDEAFVKRTSTAGHRSAPPELVCRGSVCLWACSPSRHARCWSPPAVSAAALSAVFASDFLPGCGGESSGGGRRPALLFARGQWPHRRSGRPVRHRPDRPGAIRQPLRPDSR